MRAVDLSHATPAELAGDLIGTERGADQGAISGRPSASIRLLVVRVTAMTTVEPSGERPKDSVERGDPDPQ